MTFSKSQYALAVRIIKELDPNFKILESLEHHILSVHLTEENKCEIYLSLWNVAKDYMLKYDLDYNDALKEMLKEVGAENAKKSDIKYLFYDDLPNPSLN